MSKQITFQKASGDTHAAYKHYKRLKIRSQSKTKEQFRKEAADQSKRLSKYLEQNKPA